MLPARTAGNFAFLMRFLPENTGSIERELYQSNSGRDLTGKISCIERRNRSADFPVCRIAGFQTRIPHHFEPSTDLGIGDWLVRSRSLGTAGLALASLRQSLSPLPKRLKSAGLETSATIPVHGEARAFGIQCSAFDVRCSRVLVILSRNPRVHDALTG